MTSSSSQSLLDQMVNFDVQYAGIIPEIPVDLDLTGRTDILKLLDQAIKTRLIKKWQTPTTNDAILSLNAYSIRIKAKSDEELLLCAPVHMIAAVCFVKENDGNILGIKIGEVGNNKDVSDLAVIYCETSSLAESVCQLMGQGFQLIFSNAAAQCFDKKMVEGVTTNISFLASGSASNAAEANHLAFLSDSRSELNRIQPSRPKQHSSTTQSESDQWSVYAKDLIKEYMLLLHAMLLPDELKQFAMLLKRWRGGDNLPFAEFLQKLLELYGPERKYLLARMRPFVRENDLVYFRNFLEQSGISDNAECSLSGNSPGSDMAAPQRTLRHSTNVGITEGDYSSSFVTVSAPCTLNRPSTVARPTADGHSSVPRMVPKSAALSNARHVSFQPTGTAATNITVEGADAVELNEFSRTQ